MILNRTAWQFLLYIVLGVMFWVSAFYAARMCARAAGC